MTYLDFEKPIADLFEQLEKIRQAGEKSGVDVSKTTAEIEERVERLSPSDYFTLHSRVRDNFESYDLETLAAHLEFAGWDPHIYLKTDVRKTKSDIININKSVNYNWVVSLNSEDTNTIFLTFNIFCFCLAIFNNSLDISIPVMLKKYFAI